MNMRPHPLAIMFAAILSGSAAAQFHDPSVPADGGTVIQPIQQPDGSFLGQEARKCAKGWVVGADRICVQNNQRSERMEFAILSNNVDPNPARLTNKVTLGGGGLTYIFTQDAKNPYTATYTCPAGTVAQQTDWPVPGARECVGTQAGFKKSSAGGRIYEVDPTNLYRPVRAVKSCPGGLEPVVTNWPHEGDMMCNPPAGSSPGVAVQDAVADNEIPDLVTEPPTGNQEPETEAAVEPTTPEAPTAEPDTPTAEPKKESGYWEDGKELFDEDPWKWASCTFLPWNWGSNDCAAPSKRTQETEAAKKENTMEPGLQAARERDKQIKSPAEKPPVWMTADKPHCGNNAALWHGPKKGWRCVKNNAQTQTTKRPTGQTVGGGATGTAHIDGIGNVKIKTDDKTCPGTHYFYQTKKGPKCFKRYAVHVKNTRGYPPYKGLHACPSQHTPKTNNDLYLGAKECIKNTGSTHTTNTIEKKGGHK